MTPRREHWRHQIGTTPMSIFSRAASLGALTFALVSCAPDASQDAQDAQDAVVNVYSARHYASDQALYDAFEANTGIKLNIIEADGDLLLEKVHTEGERSPADVLVTVDAGRLWVAEEAGLFQPSTSETLEARVPASLRHPDGLWHSFAQRARIVIYNKANVSPDEIASYEDLADETWRGRLCIRSSSNIYNVSLMAAMVDQLGSLGALLWAQGVTSNMARPPRGGDTDQIRAVAAGECDIAVANHYYYVRLMNSEDAADQAVVEAVGLTFPDDGAGAHFNVSAAGVAVNAPHPEAAMAFIEFLVSDEAQRLFAELSNEIPVVAGAAYDNAALRSLGEAKPDPINVNRYGVHQAEARRLLDEAGWP